MEDTIPVLAPVFAGKVLDILREHTLVDGLPMVLDLERSQGTCLVDEVSGTTYLDMFTFYSSNPLGMNHPRLCDDEFAADLLRVARNKPSNSDIYTVDYARFVATFSRVMGDPALPHYFFIDGGALAVENALKIAFDWKSRWNEAHGISPELGTRVLHLTEAFHGRSGYTLSLTNSNPIKVARFPKFDWPRIDAPYISSGRDMDAAEQDTLDQARSAFAEYPHDIACFLMEPIQGEGGDNHFRPQFVAAMKALCHSHDALFVLDEVQSGGGVTGKPWAYQHLGVTPDVLAFGKKLQVCGVMAGGRVDEVPDNVFRVSSRINSTWGGNLTDMVRSRRILEVIEAEDLFANAAARGVELLSGLRDLTRRHPSLDNPRGLGVMAAVTLPDRATRDALLRRLFSDEKVIMLGCGRRSVRLRPPLTASSDDIAAAIAALDRALTTIAKG